MISSLALPMQLTQKLVPNFAQGVREIKKLLWGEYKMIAFIHSLIYGSHMWFSYVRCHWFIVGLLVQLVKRCTGIAEVMGSNSLQTWIFFQVLFSLLQWSLSFINWFAVHIFFFIYHIQNTKFFDLKIRRASVTVILEFATRGIVWELFITVIWNIWHLKFKEICCYNFLW